MTQATQPSLDGKHIVARWKVTLSDGKHYITWAETADAARVKVEKRLVKVMRVEPVAALLDGGGR